MTKVAVERLAAGDELLVMTTDPEAAIDIAAWAGDEGHELSQRELEAWTELRVRRG